MKSSFYFSTLATAALVLMGLNVSAQATDWTSFDYVGYATGGQYTDFNTSILSRANGNGVMDTSYDPTSLAWSNTVFAGVGYIATQGWYWGGELNADYANASGFQSNVVPYGDEGGFYMENRMNVSAKWSGDVDLLFGHTLDTANHWTAYMKIGPSVTEAKLTYKAQDIQGPDTNIDSSGDVDKTILGALFGIGLRDQFADNWMWGIETDYTYYPWQTVSQTVPFDIINPPPDQEITYGFNPSMLSVKASLAFTF